MPSLGECVLILVLNVLFSCSRAMALQQIIDVADRAGHCAKGLSRTQLP